MADERITLIQTQKNSLLKTLTPFMPVFIFSLQKFGSQQLAAAWIGGVVGVGLGTQCPNAKEAVVMGLATATVIAAGAFVLRNSLEPVLVQAFIATAIFSLLGDLAGFAAVGRKTPETADAAFH